MADFQTDVLDRVAQVVGGTQSPNDPHFWSGAMAQDQTGVAGLTGCYSSPPEDIQALPVAIVMVPDQFTAELVSQGEEDNVDDVRLLVLVGIYFREAQFAQLTPFRDLVPAAFRAHMQLFGSNKGTWAFISHGRSGTYEYGKTAYLAWEFTVRVTRMLAVTYNP